jgi:hypothetical protein
VLIRYFLYIRWLEQKLILNLPANAVTELDNAFCHNVQTDRLRTVNSRTHIMKEWLDSCCICYAEDATKMKLFQIIKLDKPTFKTLLLTVFRYDIDMLFYGCLPIIRRLSQENIFGLILITDRRQFLFNNNGSVCVSVCKHMKYI